MRWHNGRFAAIPAECRLGAGTTLICVCVWLIPRLLIPPIYAPIGYKTTSPPRVNCKFRVTNPHPHQLCTLHQPLPPTPPNNQIVNMNAIFVTYQMR